MADGRYVRKEERVRKTLALLLCLTLWHTIWAAELKSVRSTDREKNQNTVNIELSGPVQYRAEKLPGGKGIRLVIQGVEKLGSSPQYPRLSEVVDQVSARMEGSNAIIDIKTMGSYNISHQASSDKSRINVSIDAGPTHKEVEAPKSEPAAKTKITIPPNAMPKKAGEPEMARGIPPSSSPTIGTIKAESASETAEKPSPDATTKQDEETQQIPLPQTDMENAAETMEDSPLDSQQPEKKGFNILWLLIAVAALLTIIVIYLFFIKKDRPKEAVAPQIMPPPPTPKEGHTLLLDPETRKKMVQKLLDQGWSTSEIAREIRLDPKLVEEIVAGLREGR
jgi:hypothetical protein